MEVPIWVAELAAEFWSEAGESEAFPRDLRRPISNAVRLAVAFLPKLSIASALRWLQENGVVCNLGSDDRSLRACLVARYGHGIALIDGTDPDDEQRYSLAHELAHFLRDYVRRRRQVVKRIGAASLEVLDGERPATLEERLHAVLRNAAIGFHVHLMERTSGGMPASREIAVAEKDADRLAYELLAPANHVWNANRCVGGACDIQTLGQCLHVTYGLPKKQALDYARILLPADDYVDPLLLRLSKTLGLRNEQ